jgi:DNA-binding SARP family transcriptional activator
MLSAGTLHRREQVAGSCIACRRNAKSNLRTTLSRLRKRLGEPYFVADDLTVGFEVNAAYWLDAALISRKIDASAPLDDWIAITSAYGGELLPGFYDEWVLLERERLQATFERKVDGLLGKLIDDQRWNDVLNWGERWIALGRPGRPIGR